MPGLRVSRTLVAFLLGVGLVLTTTCERCIGQATQVGTKTSLTVALLGPPGGQQVTSSAAVMVGGTPVTAGQVIFSINGQPLPGVQVVGSNPAHGFVSGTATLVLSLPPGEYRISARYAGTSVWTASTASPASIAVPDLGQANLQIQNATGLAFSYTLTTIGSVASLEGTVNLTDLATGLQLSAANVNSSGANLSSSQLDLSFDYTPSALLITDLSGEGTRDVVVGNPTQGTVSIYRQRSDLTWKCSQSLAVGANPIAITASDFNGDGLADLAVLNGADGTVSILLQTAPETFASQTTLRVGSMPIAMVSGDFDQNGLPDLLVANFADNTLSLLLNDETLPGTFKAAFSIPTPGGPAALAAGPLTGAGHLDVAVANYYEGTVSIFTDVPGAADLLQPFKNVDPVGDGPSAIVAADLNGDGVVDLAVTNSLDGTVSVLPGMEGAPGQFPAQYVIDGFTRPGALSLIDTVGSSQPPDLGIADASDGTLTVLRNSGFGTFPSRSVLTLGEGLGSVFSIYHSSSGAFEFAALDPALQQVHLATAAWKLTHDFEGVAPLSPALFHRVQASVRLEGSQGTLSSNLLVVPAGTLAAQSISFSPLSPVVYGAAPLALQASSTSGLPVQFSVASGPAVASGNSLSITGAGLVRVIATQPGNNSFSAAAPEERDIYVSKAQLHVNPTPARRSYGAGNPLFTGSVSGAVGTDVVQVLFSSAANLATPPGEYSTFPYGIAGTAGPDLKTTANYSVNSLIGTLTICPAISVTTGSVQTQTEQCGSSTSYGSPVPPSGTPIPSAPSAPVKVFTTLTNPTTPSVPIPTPFPTSVPPASVSAPVQPIAMPAPTAPSLPVKVISEPTSPSVPSRPASNSPSRPAPTVPVATVPQPILAPVKPPKQKHPESTNTIVPVPLPLPLPNLPSISGILGSAVPLLHRPSGLHASGSSSIVLLADHRVPPLFGWKAVTVLFSCPANKEEKETIVIAVNDAAVATLTVRSDHEYRSRVPLLSDSSARMVAYFAGSSGCASAKSAAVAVTDSGPGDLPVAETVGPDSIRPLSAPVFRQNDRPEVPFRPPTTSVEETTGPTPPGISDDQRQGRSTAPDTEPQIDESVDPEG